MTNSAKIRKTFEQNGGIFRLAPNWVPRSFCIPGRRIKLHPDRKKKDVDSPDIWYHGFYEESSTYSGFIQRDDVQ